MLVAAVLCIDGAVAQQLGTDAIVESLAPKSRTRSLKSSLSSSDAAFLAQIKTKTRGLGRADRDQLHQVAVSNEFPELDLTIMFDINSSELKVESLDTLQRLGDALKSERLATSSFVVGGHTDGRGTKHYNQQLSERRAQSVREYLIKQHGIQPERLLPVGYGQEHLKNPTDPLADENRRVQMVTLPDS